MPIALDPKQTWEYILECDRESDSPTVWTLKPLTVRDEARIEDGMAVVDHKTNSVRVMSGSQSLEILRAGLAGVRNFNDSNGVPINFNTSDLFLDRIHPKHRQELSKAIVDRYAIGETERKNSSSALA